MIELLRVFRRRRAPVLRVTNPAIIRADGFGHTEVVMVRAFMNARGILEYEEAGTLVWPTGALLEAHEEFKHAFPAHLRRYGHPIQ